VVSVQQDSPPGWRFGALLIGSLLGFFAGALLVARFNRSRLKST